MNKVFGIGLGKTGTTTLKDALQVLGYNVCGRRQEVVDLIKMESWNQIWEIVDKYDAFEDDPWPLLFKELDKKYPNSKFILTSRNEEKWIKSMVNSKGWMKDSPIREFIFGAGNPRGNEQTYLKTFQSHNQLVRDYFADSNNFIELDWSEGDGWKELCDFLDLPIPEVEFFHSNTGAYHIDDKVKLVFTSLKNRFLRRVGLKAKKNN